MKSLFFVIWLDNKLSNQLILIKVLDWYSRRDLGGVKLSLICIGDYPGLDRFPGLGALTADQTASLADARLPVNDAQFRTAQAAWNAFTSPGPTNIDRFIAPILPRCRFLPLRWCAISNSFPQPTTAYRARNGRRYPFFMNRLPSGEAISSSRCRVKRSGSSWETSSLYRMIADLAEPRHPLVQITDTPENRLGEVTLTETGRKVLDGRADHIDLNGIDQWLGGVHLKGDKAVWRWDRASERIVSHR